jgi:hypothetical protein
MPQDQGAFMSFFQPAASPVLRIVRGGELDNKTPQTPGMTDLLDRKGQLT